MLHSKCLVENIQHVAKRYPPVPNGKLPQAADLLEHVSACLCEQFNMPGLLHVENLCLCARRPMRHLGTKAVLLSQAHEDPPTSALQTSALKIGGGGRCWVHVAHRCHSLGSLHE